MMFFTSFSTQLQQQQQQKQDTFTPGLSPSKVFDDVEEFDDDEDDNAAVKTQVLFPETPHAWREKWREQQQQQQQQHGGDGDDDGDDDDGDDDVFQPQRVAAAEAEAAAEQQQQHSSPYKTPTGIRQQREEENAADEASIARLFLQSVADAEAEAAEDKIPLSVTLPNGCVVSFGNVSVRRLPYILQQINSTVLL